MEAGGLPLLRTALLERAAYRGLFKLDAMVGELEPARVGGLDGARRNAAELAAEILDILQTGGAEART
jgi:chromosome partitioning protein